MSRPYSSLHRVANFSPHAEVVVRQVTDTGWRVVEGFRYGPYVVSADDRTDFASVPRALNWALPRYGAYTLAAILHDRLWRHYVPAGDLTYREADTLFRQALDQLGVPRLRRWMMWAAVRWGALAKGDYAGWARDSWRVLPITALLLPVILPPAILVVGALAVLRVLDWTAGR